MISIIIPTFNRANFLRYTLDSILNQNFPADHYEVLIVDNGSTDSTKEVSLRIIQENPDRNVRYFFEPTPGLLSARHRGAFEAKGNILTFVDDDILPFSQWLMSISKTFEDPKIHLVGGKSLPKYMVPPPVWLDSLWHSTPYGGKGCVHLSLQDLGNSKMEIHPNYVFGLNFSIRKETLFAVGGFHPDLYPKYLQKFQGDGETGLTICLAKGGFKAIYNPEASVYHMIPADRMTPEYFENRMFYQGVCNSYTDLRSQMAGIGSHGRIISTEKLYTTFRNIWRFVQRSVNFVKVYITLNESRHVQIKMQRAYQRGYDFHQKEVKNDPLLLRWVLKENYWDYSLPYIVNQNQDVSKTTKSY